MIEDVLGAVTVMHVPVGDQNSVDSGHGERVPSGEGHVVEQTKPHCLVGGGVVAWRADRAEGIGGRSGYHCLDRGPRTGNRGECCFPTGRRHGRVGVQAYNPPGVGGLVTV